MSRSEQLPSQSEAWEVQKTQRREKKEARDKERSKRPQHEENEQKKSKRPQHDDNEQKKSKKRKREALPDEIEIDVNLPEPASKKAARKAKKDHAKPSSAEDAGADSKPKGDKQDDEKKDAQRSEYGVWIGNLPWSATKDTLRAFITDNSEITAEQITRVHMPPPTKPANPRWTFKPLNKGFAYVDFSTQLAMFAAIALTETKMDGRPLLIKNAKSFEGRPEKPKAAESGETSTNGASGNPPNKRVFVGNLAFDVTKDDLLTHYGQCGDVADIHMATFEDSGKCKGYAWVTFETVDAATSAVKGFVFKEDTRKDKDASSDEEEQKKASKKRKWFINRLMGRELRCEFAEDSTTRYNKRYGKEKKEDLEGVHPDRQRHFDGEEQPHRQRTQHQPRDKRPRGKIDPRTVRPGAAHTNAPRASQAIVEPKGKKLTFD